MRQTFGELQLDVGKLGRRGGVVQFSLGKIIFQTKGQGQGTRDGAGGSECNEYNKQ